MGQASRYYPTFFRFFRRLLIRSSKLPQGNDNNDDDALNDVFSTELPLQTSHLEMGLGSVS